MGELVAPPRQGAAARGLALVAVLSLGLVGVRELWELEPDLPPMPPCDAPVEVVEAGRGRLACATDDDVRACGSFGAGDRVVLPSCERQQGAMAGRMRLVIGLPLDVNRATAEELELIRGVGARTAKAIVQHREQHGAFPNLESLTQVKGIGDASVERYREVLAVFPMQPGPAPTPPESAEAARAVP